MEDWKLRAEAAEALLADARAELEAMLVIHTALDKATR